MAVELDAVAIAKRRIAANALAENAHGRCGDVQVRKPRGDAGALERIRDGGACGETNLDFGHRAGQRVDNGDSDLAHAA